MANNTLKDLYNSLGNVPPKTAWLQRVAKAAKVSVFTVRMWVAGRQTPQPGIQELVSRELGVPAEELFPQRDDEQNLETSNHDSRHGLL